MADDFILLCIINSVDWVVFFKLISSEFQQRLFLSVSGCDEAMQRGELNTLPVDHSRRGQP